MGVAVAEGIAAGVGAGGVGVAVGSGGAVPSAVADGAALALGLGEPLVRVHQRVVEGEERPELLRPVGQHQEHVRHEAGLLLHGQDTFLDVFRQAVDFRHRKARDGMVGHGQGLPLGRY